jgi:nucleotide-binding universal stress UspA family protein
MKILFAADGSPFTKKALAFLVANPNLLEDCELVVLHVQPALPPRVTALAGASAVDDYHREEAERVIAPIEEFLRHHDVAFQSMWVVGQPVRDVLHFCSREHAHMIVMGTHGYGLLGRAVMGSVAHGVFSGADVPVLLVK